MCYVYKWLNGRLLITSPIAGDIGHVKTVTPVRDILMRKF